MTTIDVAPRATRTLVFHAQQHLTVEREAGGRITIFTLHDSSRQTIDAWTGAVRAMLATTRPGRPLLVMYDCSAIKLNITPYLRRRIMEIRQLNPPLPGRFAVVIPQPAVAAVARMLHSTHFQGQYVREGRIVATPEEGLAWLRAVLVHREHL